MLYMNDANLRKSSDNAVEIKTLSYTYPRGNGQALKDVNVRAGSHKLIALMGRTGAGKTTLLRTLNGLVPQFFEGSLDGRVLIMGNDTHGIPVQRQIRDVALVLQDPETQIFGMTVEKDIAFGPSNLDYPRPKIRENVARAVQMTGIEGLLTKSPENLSGGEKQKVAIAGILALDSPLLAFDEPTAELDPQAADEIYRLLDQLVRAGQRTVIFSSHHPRFILQNADELWVLDEGRLVFCGPPADFFKQKQNAESYGLQLPEVSDLFLHLLHEDLYNEPVLPLTVSDAAEKLKNIIKRPLSPGAGTLEIAEQQTAQEKEKLIEIRNIGYLYPGGYRALDDVTLDFFRREIVAIVGKNGAGKTTLVKQINGLLRPTSGEVLLEGQNNREMEIEEISQHVGYVFQNPDHQIFSPSVFEEVEYGLRNSAVPETERKQRIIEALDLTGLKGREQIHPFNLSKGERQKLALASVLALQPETIIVDEPTTGLDWAGALKIMQEIKHLKERGHTIIMITHNMRLVAEYADRVVIMNRGRLIRQGKVNEVLAERELLMANNLQPTQISLLVQELASLGIPPTVYKIGQLLDLIRKHVKAENVN
jgi:energy-coupling factor transport system ATP-binding protein